MQDCEWMLELIVKTQLDDELINFLKNILIDFFKEASQLLENKASRLNGNYKNNQLFYWNSKKK